MQLSRRTYYHRPKVCVDDPSLIDRIEQICLEYPRYGYRRVTHQLKREGLSINHKKVSRIYTVSVQSGQNRQSKGVS